MDRDYLEHVSHYIIATLISFRLLRTLKFDYFKLNLFGKKGSLIQAKVLFVVVAFDFSFGVFLLLGDIVFIFEEYQPREKSTFANK